MSSPQLFVSEKKMPLMHLPVVSSVLQLKDARVFLSPGSGLSKEELLKAGNVTDIVAPSLFHTNCVKLATEVWPDAKVWFAPGAKEHAPGVRLTNQLSKDHWPFKDELVMIPVEGIPKINEIVFYHKPTKTLFVSDLLFNIEKPQGIGAWIILHMFGTYAKLGVSRFFLRFSQDMTAFRASIAQIMAYDIQKLVVAHGDPIESGAKARLQKAFEERGLL